MKIPKKIKIGSLVYSIGILENSEQENFFGRSSLPGQWINLNPSLLEEKKRETLIHEIVHQILDQGKYFTESKNEKLVACLANGIYRTLKENHLFGGHNK